jgi:hypothetical protein
VRKNIVAAIRPDYAVYYGAAASTAIAGILHLLVSSDAIRFNEMNLAILFAIAGIAQIFYALPIVRRWGRPWYYAGTIGTAILIILWIGTRIPSGRVLGGYSELLPINTMGITVLIFQFATLLLSIRILQTATTPSGINKWGEKKSDHDATAAS